MTEPDPFTACDQQSPEPMIVDKRFKGNSRVAHCTRARHHAGDHMEIDRDTFARRAVWPRSD